MWDDVKDIFEEYVRQLWLYNRALDVTSFVWVCRLVNAHVCVDFTVLHKRKVFCLVLVTYPLPRCVFKT